ncbi:MAG: flagellar basal body P-ring formation protein FlgA [Rhodospirillales bacterium]|nr:flagellar basal body P-ring formation protein FlgA [Rhodospirillales bacterium]
MKSFALLIVFLFAAIVAAATPAPAQSLRTDVVMVEGDLVRLSDIFDGVATDRPVLRAPAPGRRVSVEIQQLIEIARANGLSWRPQTRFDRVLVERMGKTLDQNDILPVLRRALVAEGARAADEIDLGSRSIAISLPLDAPADVEVRQIQYDRATGRFMATLHAGGSHAGAQRATIQGRVFATARLPVLRRSIAVGETIRATDIEMAQVREDNARRDLISNPDKLIGLTARQRLREREPVREIDVRPATLVARNAHVTIVLQIGNLSLTAQGRAVEEGAKGDTVRVLNTTSNRQIEGVVVAPDTVAVTLGPRVAALAPQ